MISSRNRSTAPSIVGTAFRFFCILWLSKNVNGIRSGGSGGNNRGGSGGETADYGVDVSFPIHRDWVSTNYAWLPHNDPKHRMETPDEYKDQPIQPLGDRKAFYDHLMDGCANFYDLERCQESERQRIERNRFRPAAMANFTTKGFAKIRAPPELWTLISEFWKQNGLKKGGNLHGREQYETSNWSLEGWEYGAFTVNHWESPTYMMSLHNESLIGGGRPLENAIWDASQKTLEAWVGKRLRGCSLYGVRVYTEGAILHTHIDRLPLVTSAIINVAQDTDEPWPLEVIGHDGKAHNITMDPGDMVLYESHTILHGRPFPLKGHFMANIFVHFEPLPNVENAMPPYFQHTAAGQRYYEIMLNEKRQKEPQNAAIANNLVHSLAGTGRRDDLRTLVEQDPRLVHLEDEAGWQPIHEAARGGHIDIIHFLLKHGANINAITNQGETPLFIAERFLGATSPVLQFIRSKGGIRNEGTFHLKLPKTYPHSLAGDGNIHALKDVVERNRKLVHLPDPNGWTPLHEAARGGHVHVAQYLLEKGAQMNAATKDGGTPLYIAAKYLGPESVMYEFLKSLGAIHQGPEL